MRVQLNEFLGHVRFRHQHPGITDRKIDRRALIALSGLRVPEICHLPGCAPHRGPLRF
jgi:hypothetical protein